MAVSFGRRILSILAGILLIFSGVYVFVNPEFVPTLIRVIGIFMLVGGLFLIIEAARLPSSVTVRNSWIVDGVLMMLIGGVFTFASSYITLAALGYTFVFWFIYTSVLQIWVATKIQSSGNTKAALIKWLIIILSVLVILFSLYALFNPGFTQLLLYTIVSFQFIFLGIVRFLLAFIV